MEEICSIAQFMLTKVSGWCCWFLGGFDNPLRTLIALTAAGELTGIIRAYKDHDLSVKFFLELICKIPLIFIIVGAANVLDIWIEGRALRSTSLLFYIYNEGLSLIKNMDYLHFPIPEPLRQMIKRLPDNQKTNDSEVRPDKDADGGKPVGHEVGSYEEGGHESDRDKTDGSP